MKRLLLCVALAILINHAWGQAYDSNTTIAKIPLASISKENVYLTDSNNQKIYLFDGFSKSTLTVDTIDEEVYYFKITLEPEKPVAFKNLEISMQFMPDSVGIWERIRESFHWLPNLKQNENQIISQHVFRSPAIILTHNESSLSFIPDLDLLAKYQVAPYYLDIEYRDDGIDLKYGISDYVVTPHQFYERVYPVFELPEKLEIGFYVISSQNSSPLDIVKRTNSFLWSTFGSSYQNSILPQTLPFNEYARVGYSMAFEKFWVDGAEPNTGGITLSTFLNKETNEYRGRFSKDDLWFHSWFNNIRTAYGLYYWGEQEKNALWCGKALEMINLFLTAPQIDGFFPTIWTPQSNTWISSGQGGGEGLYHVPDNIWTAYWLMRFNDELNEIPGIDSFLNRFTSSLLKTQNPNGSFPARVRVDDLSTDPILSSSASSAIVTWFLAEMLIRNKVDSHQADNVSKSVKKSLAYLDQEILPMQRFEDFEVYFSCSPKPQDYFDSLTYMYPQNTLSIQWSAEAFLSAYRLYNDPLYLSQGEYCLGILSLYQQVWNPPYISLYAFGGFGAQNSDAEWSDARQAQFAETLLNYYFTTKNPEYLQRAVYATRASFALMAIPENEHIAPFNYTGLYYNGEHIGGMAENYGHEGINGRTFQSGFHWGTGSALTTAAIFKSKLGNLYIDSKTQTVIGVDGVVVKDKEWSSHSLQINTTRLKGIESLEIITDSKEKLPDTILIDDVESAIIVK